MKIKGNIFVKTLKTIVIAFVFMLCSNTNAATASTNTVSLNLDAISTTSHLASADVYALTGNWWQRLVNWWNGLSDDDKDAIREKICSYCSRHYTGSHCSNNHGGSSDDGSSDSDSIPLDGGLSILVLGAAAFGVRKLRNKKK